MPIDPTPKKPLFEPLPNRRAFEEIARQIRESIYSGVLRPGDKLPSERELASQFGGGRVSVREALRTLEQSGLICIKRGGSGGAFVKDADSSVIAESLYGLLRRSNVSLRDLAEVRMGITRLVLEAAVARFDVLDLELIERQVYDGEEIIEKGIEGSVQLFRERLGETYAGFHRALAKATKNPAFEVLAEALVNIGDALSVENVIPLDAFKDHAKVHRALLEALRTGDLAAALSIMEEHEQRVTAHFSPFFGAKMPLQPLRR